ncbi:Glucan synthase-like 5 [Hibiscus syriacus]|uniref:Glucan synthase-like 5 n=1 Tax=Hibiscus syriacus TaxID=106335 RepID=A0A6A3CH91_HIBSY|nr:preprotein translocase subunit SECE1-like [Hibiscus syriacus]KAE8728147.1 Glucan synthase-like 5 [Hibiscus syriacus]
MAASLLLPFASPTKTAALTLTYSHSKSVIASRHVFSIPSKTKHLPKVSGDTNKYRLFPIKAIEESKESVEDSVTAKEAEAEVEASSSEESELSAIGAEIKKAIKEREANSDSLAGGVAEEIREIEWPAFGKVLGTTGVVLGVIAGSSVVLLTVNAVLAELSDRVFAGKGVQDFFS